MTSIRNQAAAMLLTYALSGTSFAQEAAPANAIRTSPDRCAGLQKLDKQHYRIEVRFISVSERI